MCFPEPLEDCCGKKKHNCLVTQGQRYTCIFLDTFSRLSELVRLIPSRGGGLGTHDLTRVEKFEDLKLAGLTLVKDPTLL